MNNIDVNKIKLVIWDLDDTFWSGTISEGKIDLIQNNIELVNTLTDCGIINSICSKNDYDIAKNALEKADIWDLFIHPSINWESKGNRIKELISDLQLRDSNVLFIDDNVSNLNEVKYYNNNIMTLEAQYLPELYKEVSDLPKKDIKRSRLNQYKIIEKKLKKKSETSSNIEFLKSCNIKAHIKTDCITQIDRLHEIIMRTNQLNYTKNRVTLEELTSDVNDPLCSCGYVEVTDDFGDYGIIGFYCLEKNELKHFAFSCRCMGMGIEQYIYAQLGFPKLTVVGDVTIPLSDNVTPDWINHSNENSAKEKNNINNDIQILLKGPCDMSQIFSFINESENIDCEFTYISDKGVSIEQHNHTQCILQSLSIDNDTKHKIISELPFGDKEMFNQKMFFKKYNIIFFSTLTDGGLGVYKRKTGEYIAFGEYIHPLTDEQEWEGYINKTTPNSNCTFTEEQLSYIKENYEFIGRMSPDDIIANIKSILRQIDTSTRLVLILGSEKPYLNNTNKNYDNRHIFHKELNDKIKNLAETVPNLEYIEFNKYIKSQNDYFNNINHFMKHVYYDVSKEMLSLINNLFNINLSNKSKMSVFKISMKQKIKKFLKKL